jgi:serine protease Do
LITLEGDVAGILCPLSPDNANVEAGAQWYDSGIGFAVPLAGYQRMIDKLAQGINLHRGLLGVSMKGKDMFADQPVIGYCRPKSPATAAGLQVGDQLLTIDGTPLKSHAEMKHLLGPMIAGDEVELSLLRESETLTVTATLTDKIDPFEELSLGIVPRRTNKDELEIWHVLSGGPGGKSGLKAGDTLKAIDEEELRSWEQLQEKLNQLTPQQETVLTVVSSQKGEDAPAPKKLPFTTTPTRATPPVGLPKAIDLASDDDAKAEVIEIKVIDSSNRCFAIVPENDFATVGKPALFVWVSEPGVLDSAETLKATAAECQRNNMVLMIPQSLDQKSWTPGEREFISKAVQRLARQVDFDPRRVAIGGEKTAGTMACLTAFTNRTQFQGLVMFDALFPARLPQVETRPNERLLIYFANSDEFKSGKRLARTVEALEKKKFPVHKNPANFKRLIALLPELADWINTLDRR